MKICVLKNLAKAAFVVALLFSINVKGQIKWSGEYGNEWLVGGQKYARISVKSKGIFQVNYADVPGGFTAPTDLNHVQLWHRGKQVEILEVTSTGILFYGEPNDGKYDELLMRPDPNQPSLTGRMNKYVSLFSEQGVYFLTEGTTNGLRASSVSSTSIHNVSNPAVTYHMKTDTVAYKNDISSTTQTSTYPEFLNSYYDYWETLTGPRVSGSATSTNAFAIKNPSSAVSPGNPVHVKLMVHSRAKLTQKIKIQVRKKNGGTRDIMEFDVARFAGKIQEFDLDLSQDVGTDPPGTDGIPLGNIGEGDILVTSTSSEGTPRFSVSYYVITYPQDLNAQEKSFFVMKLPGTSSGDPTKLTVTSLPSPGPVRVLDISNVDEPVVITDVDFAAFSVPRTANQDLDLLLCSKVAVVAASSLSTYEAKSKIYSDYSAKDFIIITTNEETMVTAAQEYADYRSGTKNKLTNANFKPIVLKIEDIYNQYNFGEPSTVAVRRCMDFLLQNKNFNKFLFLIGNSVTFNNGSKDRANDVPTVGYPGSDFLLVSGLAEQTLDFQTIPVGRLPAGTAAKVEAYLTKVKEYEDFSNSTAYRTNVIHIAGGKTIDEITSFSGELGDRSIANVTPVTPFGGTTFAYTKNTSEPCPDDHGGYVDCQTEANPDIVTKVNAGAGVMTYYGHGNTRVTDYFFGYVSDDTRGYVDNTDLKKGQYTSMFLYGCDVNNVFTGVNENSGTALGNNTKRAFTIDWLLTPKRGAITVVGNSWEGYESVLTPLLRKEYSKVFVQDGSKKHIGSILKAAINETTGTLPEARIAAVEPDEDAYNYNYALANVHQTLLLGDPAMVLTKLTAGSTLPVEWASISAKASENGANRVEWGTLSERNNSYFVVERSQDGKRFEKIGQVKADGDSDRLTSYQFLDVSPYLGLNYYRVGQMDISQAAAGEGKLSYSRIISVENEVLDKELFVSPNPGNGIFKINKNPKFEMASWSLYNSKGSLLIENSRSGDVDLTNLPDGLYILYITDKNDNVFTRKLAKE